MSISEMLRNWLLEPALQRMNQMEVTLMGQLEDLNTAIQQEDVEVQDILASVTKVGADIDALWAKIAAGGNPTDLTAQLQAIQSHVASLTTAAQQLKDEDTKATA